ncbi:CRISPR-associated helicase Cas3' [Clostridiaceae bacterium]|nr:CRISPR-associated helicase Cas3' [Clostridiaceae bacterium]
MKNASGGASGGVSVKYAHFKITAASAIRYESVRTHLEDTASLSGQSAAKIGMPETGRLLGFLHDAGKFSDAYQAYLDGCMQYESGNAAAPPQKGSVDHGIFGAAYVIEELCDGANPHSGLTAEILAMVIAGHHGGLRDYLGPDTSTPLWSRMEQYLNHKREEYEQIKEELEREIPRAQLRQMFSGSVQEMKLLKTRLPEFTKFQLHLAVRFLYSCLIDADRESTRLFMEGEKPEPECRDWRTYELRLERFLETLRGREPETLSEKRINALREGISDACHAAGGWPRGVYKLTVPTGGGKTFAGMRLALHHMRREDTAGRGHIIQVLPFTSIIEQNAEAVREALQCGEDLLEHHSNVVTETPEEGSAQEHNLSAEQYRLLTERWNADFIFTTTVQFLNTVYGSGTQNIRRMHSLADSVIIMDEVQALPLKTMKLFGELANFLYHACNTTILLCTATQPDLEKRPIGLKTDVKEIIPNVNEVFQKFQRMEVQDKTLEGGYSTEAAADFLEEAKREVNSLLVVMNTKTIARQLYEMLRKRMSGRAEIFYITTELCPAHRSDVIARLKESLKQGCPLICVSTSVLEAGVDISFERVVRNLAGLDSIAQSSGRGNRHGEHEKNGVTYIINMADERLGSMREIAVGEEKTKAVLDTYRRRPEAYHGSLLSPAAMSDYYQKYFGAADIEDQMKYPLKEDAEIRDLYSYFTKTGDKALRRRYESRKGTYRWKLTYPFETAGKKFRVIDEDTVSILVPYKRGKELIQQILEKDGRFQLGEIRRLIREARPFFVNLYTDKLRVYQDAVAASPVPGLLILRDGYYDETIGIREEQALEFLLF